MTNREQILKYFRTLKEPQTAVQVARGMKTDKAIVYPVISYLVKIGHVQKLPAVVFEGGVFHRYIGKGVATEEQAIPYEKIDNKGKSIQENLMFLFKNGSVPLSPISACDLLRKAKVDTTVHFVGQCLMKLKKAGKLQKISRGLYTLRPENKPAEPEPVEAEPEEQREFIMVRTLRRAAPGEAPYGGLAGVAFAYLSFFSPASRSTQDFYHDLGLPAASLRSIGSRHQWVVRSTDPKKGKVYRARVRGGRISIFRRSKKTLVAWADAMQTRVERMLKWDVPEESYTHAIWKAEKVVQKALKMVREAAPIEKVLPRQSAEVDIKELEIAEEIQEPLVVQVVAPAAVPVTDVPSSAALMNDLIARLVEAAHEIRETRRGQQQVVDGLEVLAQEQRDTRRETLKQLKTLAFLVVTIGEALRNSSLPTPFKLRLEEALLEVSENFQVTLGEEPQEELAPASSCG